MATRGYIGIEHEDGTVSYIYSHWDNYLSCNGSKLLNFYQDRNKVDKLISLGDVSSLGDEIGEKHNFNDVSKDVCNFYGRDREEEWDGIKPNKLDSVQDFWKLDEEYLYLYGTDSKWYYSPYNRFVAQLTTEAIIGEDSEDESE